MKFLMTEEDALLSETARGYFADVTSQCESGGGRTDVARALGDQGWIGITIGTDSDAVGASPVLAAEAAGWARLPYAFSELAVAVPAALAMSADAQPVLDAVLAGAATWSTAGVDVAVDGLRGRDPLRATRVGGSWSVSGRAFHVHAASASAGFLAVALDDDAQPGVFLVEQGGAVAVTNDVAADEACPTGTVTFTAAPSGIRLPDDALARLCRWGAAASAAEMLGAAAALRDMTVVYAKDRQQFGVPIGSFQAVKHHCADMQVLVESLRVAVWAAGVHAVDQEAGIDHVAVAKSRAADATMEVGRLALQVHGGIGFTWEHPLHRFVKRIMRLQAEFGDAHWHREQLAAVHLTGRPA